MTNFYPDLVARETPSARPSASLSRLTIMLLIMALLSAGLIGFHGFKAKLLRHITEKIQSTEPTVATIAATAQPWQTSLAAVGSLRASNGADIAPEIPGVIDAISFQSGATVPAGTPLVHLRLNDDPAKLAQLQATAELDAITLKRDQRQFSALGVARSVVDTDICNLKVAQAQVAAQQAVINEKTITAPFTGRLGVRQVDVGQYVAAGTALVTLQALDPMLVDFYLPQRALGDIKVGSQVVVTVDAYPGKSFNGTITSLNAKIDSASRMLQIRAAIANADGALLPGMFANVSVAIGQPHKLVTVPITAVAYNPYGSLVYVVRGTPSADGQAAPKVYQHFVTTGAERGDQVSILAGLNPGDQVVTAGQMKLQDGTTIKIDNSVTPPDAATATAQDP